MYDKIDVPGVGKVEIDDEYYVCHDIDSDIGKIDFEFERTVPLDKAKEYLTAILARVVDIDNKAQVYIRSKLKSNIVGELFEPCFTVEEEDIDGSFTVTYSNSKDDDMKLDVDFEGDVIPCRLYLDESP